MQITNRAQLPSPLPELAGQSVYLPQPNIFRVTELIGPPMIRKLLNERWNDIVVDAEDFLPALLGTSWHNMVSSYPLEGVHQERRLSMEIDGQTITGGVDWYLESEGWVIDWKTASTWAWTFGKAEWEDQLNLYAELLRRAGHKVTRLTNVVLFMGWSPAEAQRKSPDEYPPRRLMLVEQPIWTPEQVEVFIKHRLEVHGRCIACTDEERWGRGGSFAVVKPGQARAMSGSVCETKREAEEFCRTKNVPPSYIVERPKMYKRCEAYCPVRSVCPVAAAMPHMQSKIESEEF